MEHGDALRPQVTAMGRDGSRFEYFALAGSGYSPGETGWLLILSGRPEMIPPQPLTAIDVVGDLESMGVDAARETVAFFTEEMVSALEAGDVAPPRHDDEPDAQRRLQQLRDELAAVAASR